MDHHREGSERYYPIISRRTATMTHHCLRRSRITLGTAFSRLKKRPRQNPARPCSVHSVPVRTVGFFMMKPVSGRPVGGVLSCGSVNRFIPAFLLSLISDFPLLFQVVLACSRDIANSSLFPCGRFKRIHRFSHKALSRALISVSYSSSIA